MTLPLGKQWIVLALVYTYDQLNQYDSSYVQVG